MRTSFTLLTRVLQKYFHVVGNYLLLSPPCPPSLPPVPVQFSPAATSPRHVRSSLLTTALGARLQNDISVSPSWRQDTCVQRRGMIRSQPHAHPQGLKGQLSKLGKGASSLDQGTKRQHQWQGLGGRSTSSKTWPLQRVWVHLLKDSPSKGWRPHKGLHLWLGQCILEMLLPSPHLDFRSSGPADTVLRHTGHR